MNFPCGISDLSVYPVLAYLATFVIAMKTIQIFTIPGNVCEIILKTLIRNIFKAVVEPFFRAQAMDFLLI